MGVMIANLDFLQCKYAIRLACGVDVEEAKLERTRVLRFDRADEVGSHQQVGYVGAEDDWKQGCLILKLRPEISELCEHYNLPVRSPPPTKPSTVFFGLN